MTNDAEAALHWLSTELTRLTSSDNGIPPVITVSYGPVETRITVQSHQHPAPLTVSTRNDHGLDGMVRAYVRLVSYFNGGTP